MVVLPIHLKWSGPTEFDTGNAHQLRRLYEIVLREGGAADVKQFIDLDRLREVWPELVLPAHVRRAWVDYFRVKHGIRLPDMALPVSATAESRVRG